MPVKSETCMVLCMYSIWIKQNIIAYNCYISQKSLLMILLDANVGWSITVIFLRDKRRILFLGATTEGAIIKGLQFIIYILKSLFNLLVYIYSVFLWAYNRNIFKLTSHAFGQSGRSCRPLHHRPCGIWHRILSQIKLCLCQSYHSFFFCPLEVPGLSVWSCCPFRKRRIFSIVASWYSWDHLCQEKATGIWWCAL